MAIILYPTTSWNGFISVDDYKTFATENIPSSQINTTDLTDAEIEIYIKQATRLIKNKITLPGTLEENLIEATAYLTNYSVGVDMTNSSSDSNIKVDEVVGVVKTEYFAPNQPQNSFPDIVEMLLSGYGVTSDDSFSFVRG